LADVLDRVLDKGLVVAGDIQVNLLEIELLTIKLRLLVASVDRAKEMGIDWWEHDPSLSSSTDRDKTLDDTRMQRLEERLDRIESAVTGRTNAVGNDAEPKAVPTTRSDDHG
jgi:hypothetical protein